MSNKGLRVGSHTFGAAEPMVPTSLEMHTVLSDAHLGSHGSRKEVRTMRVAFIGLDQIGRTMALRLLEAGHQLTMFDPDREIPDALRSKGASVAKSIEDACQSANAVFTMLTNDEATEAVILGQRGVVESLPGNAIHIGSSTVSTECSDRIVEAHWDAGKKYVSAPILVLSVSAAVKQLMLIVGGHAATITEIEPLLRRIGQVASLSGWPSRANRVQLDARCGATRIAFSSSSSP